MKSSAAETSVPATLAAPPLSSSRDALRVLLIVAAAAILGLVLNSQSRRPLPILSADGPGALPDRAPRIAASELTGKSRSVALLIDIRELDAVQKGSPKGALHAPMSRFIEEINIQDMVAKMAAAEVVVLVCESAECPLADRAYKLLEPLKLPNLRVLDGGWESYEKQGLPIETLTPPPATETPPAPDSNGAKEAKK